MCLLQVLQVLNRYMLNNCVYSLNKQGDCYVHHTKEAVKQTLHTLPTVVMCPETFLVLVLLMLLLILNARLSIGSIDTPVIDLPTSTREPEKYLNAGTKPGLRFSVFQLKYVNLIQYHFIQEYVSCEHNI